MLCGMLWCDRMCYVVLGDVALPRDYTRACATALYYNSDHTTQHNTTHDNIWQDVTVVYFSVAGALLYIVGRGLAGCGVVGLGVSWLGWAWCFVALHGFIVRACTVLALLCYDVS